MPPFTIDTMTTTLEADPAEFRSAFEQQCALLVAPSPFAPALLRTLMTRAANASFIDDDVGYIGKREIEAPQRVGGTISLMLARQAFLRWLEEATSQSPLRDIAGRLAQARADSPHVLDWHNDLADITRKLGVVINLSDTPFAGGEFEIRRTGSNQPLLSHHLVQPGTMLIFALKFGLEHRVTKVISGGPRRVYAGWFLSEPELPPRPAPVATTAILTRS